MLQGLILIEICLLLFGRRIKGKKKRGKEKWPDAFFPSAGVVHTLLAVLGRIFMSIRCNKVGFKGQSLNFYLHLTWWRLLFLLGAIRITQVWIQVKEFSDVTELRDLNPSPPLATIFSPWFLFINAAGCTDVWHIEIKNCFSS
jgi:hypothetical protein